MNNQLFLPKKAAEVEGARTRIAYSAGGPLSSWKCSRNTRMS